MPPPKPYRRWSDLAAYQFDSAVLYVGLVIENALQEHEEYGPTNARESRQKYSLTQLLDDDFRLPVSGSPGRVPAQGAQPTAAQGGVKAMALTYPGAVGRWKQVAQ